MTARLTPAAERQLAAFLQTMGDTRDWSANTRATYLISLRGCFRAVGLEKGDLGRLTRARVVAWLAEQERAGVPASSRARHLSAVRQFTAYLQAEGLLDRDPLAGMASVRVSQTRLLPLTDEELAQLLAARPPQRQLLYSQDLAMLHLLADTGLRVSELAALRPDNVLIDRGAGSIELQIVGSAGSRSVPLTDQTARALATWLTGRQRRRGCDELFTNRFGGQFKRQGLWQLVGQYGWAAGISRPVNPRLLRCTAAARLLRALPAEEVLRRLGVASMAELTLARKGG